MSAGTPWLCLRLSGQVHFRLRHSPCGKRGIIGKEARGIAPRLPIQIANRTNLPPMRGQMHRLVEPRKCAGGKLLPGEESR
jgi:hypothetical protein